jgi:hypothetical protein
MHRRHVVEDILGEQGPIGDDKQEQMVAALEAEAVRCCPAESKLASKPVKLTTLCPLHRLTRTGGGAGCLLPLPARLLLPTCTWP